MRVLDRLIVAATLASRTLGSDHTESDSDAVTSSANIGDYIAAGLALEKTTPQTASPNSFTFSNGTFNTSVILPATSAGSSNTTFKASLLSSATSAARSGTILDASGLSSTTSARSSNATLEASLLSAAASARSSNATIEASLLSSATGIGYSSNTTYANTTVAGVNTVTITSTSRITSCRPSSTDSRGQLWSDCDTEAVQVTKTFTNTTWAPATDADECWTDWVSYWSMHKPSSATLTYITNLLPETTEVITYLHTLGTVVTDKTITSTSLSTAPTVADNGGFTTTMSQVVVTYITVLTSYLSATSTSTSLYTWIHEPQEYDFSTISASDDANWPHPVCTLPPVYPECQSQWEEYAAHNAALFPKPLPANCQFNVLNMSQSAPACYTEMQSSWDSWHSFVNEATSPICSQASITGALCTSMKDAYVVGHNNNLDPMLPIGGTISSGYYSNMNPAFTGWTWPSSQAFAPGCTLDCGRCAVTGGTIELLYFPPGMTHPETMPVVATTLGTVLTSPTYYISFESLYASDACSGVGTTLTSMILAIPTSEPLSTLFATTMPCDAHRLNNPGLNQIAIGTAAMNVSDLMHESVPYSIYTSQPYCASQMMSAACDPDSCPTTLPYRPLIVLSSELLNTLDPAWGSCSLDLRGLYDPPKALQAATAVVVPTMPGVSPTTSATPASGPAGATPDPTALPEQDDPTPSQRPVDPPAPASPTTKATDPTPNDPPAPASPSAKVTTSPQNDPPPVASQQNPADPASKPGSPAPAANQGTSADPAPKPNDPPSAVSQPDSADPAGTLVSLIAGMSNGGVASQNPAADPETTGLGGAAAMPPPAQNPANSPTDALGALTASSAGPLGSDGRPVASNAEGGNNNDGPSQPAASNGDAGQVVGGSPVTFSVGSQAITAVPGQPLVIAGSTLGSNAAVTVSGHTYSSAGAGLVVDGASTIALPSSGSVVSAAVVTIGSQTFTASAADSDQPSALVIAGTTLAPGDSAATIGGVVFSAGSAGLVVDGLQTIPLTDVVPPPTAAAASQTALTLGSSTITAMLPSGTGNVAVIDGTTLTPGGSAATIGGAVVSAGDAGLVIDGSQTVPLTAIASMPTAASQAVLTLGSSTITAVSLSGPGDKVVVDGTTLSPGGSAITIDGTELSVGTAGLVVAGTRTAAFTAIAPKPTGEAASQVVLTLGGSTITAISPSGAGDKIIIDGTTLSPGGSAITIDGTELSAGTAGLVVGGTRTASLTATASPTQTDGSPAGTPTAADPGSTASNTQSGGRRAFAAQQAWLYVLLASWIVLML